jgi:hypothetical protein
VAAMPKGTDVRGICFSCTGDQSLLREPCGMRTVWRDVYVAPRSDMVVARAAPDQPRSVRWGREALRKFDYEVRLVAGRELNLVARLPVLVQPREGRGASAPDCCLEYVYSQVSLEGLTHSTRCLRGGVKPARRAIDAEVCSSTPRSSRWPSLLRCRCLAVEGTTVHAFIMDQAELGILLGVSLSSNSRKHHIVSSPITRRTDCRSPADHTTRCPTGKPGNIDELQDTFTIQPQPSTII